MVYNGADYDWNFKVIRGYLVAVLLLVLGSAGVVAIATQASRSLSTDKSTKPVAKAPEKTPPGQAGMRPVADAKPDAGTPEAAMAASSVDAGVAKAVDAEAPRPVMPDAAVVAAGPPKHTGPTPALVVEFKVSSSSPSRKARKAVRRLVREHGYKHVHYLLTGYAAEKRRPKRNRRLARKRCRKVARLIRKRGVSRRWFKCGDPVYRQLKGKATDADKVPAWRKVEIRLEKK
jgi:outer membrane protein OmpA-like peptidoglycan-associated protein